MSVLARPDLVDLRALTDTWRIRRDTEGLPMIPGRRGNVSAHDLTTLCVDVHGRHYLLKLLRALPAGWRCHQVGDDEANLLAPLADLDLACRMVRAYRRRRLSEEHKVRLLAAGHPFSSRRHESSERVSDLESTIRLVGAP